MYTAIGNYIRERRQDLGLSQEQLAERVGGSYGQSDISRIERGHIELPRLATLVSLAAALEVPVGNLLIASGWFNESHFAELNPADAAEQDSLGNVLEEIEAELDVIQSLEQQADTRSNRLRVMIRDLKMSQDLSVSMTDLEEEPG
jgi:transcriptional regulator with XRE-family HTH domain